MSPTVTVVVVPRERFSVALRALRSILDHTAIPYEMVYVDGGSPEPVRAELAKEARIHGFSVIRTEHYLSPNEARNLGLARVKTPYVVFIDNDVLTEDGWLDGLVSCAEETGAWVVGSLLFEHEADEGIAHNAGGELAFEGAPGRRELLVRNSFGHRPVAELASEADVRKVGYVEFHCVLVRRSAFDVIGRLDEGLRSSREHLDLCLQVAEAGGEIWCTTRSQVTYHNPPPITRADLAFFELRWSERWNRASLDHFSAKYGLSNSYRRRKRADANRRRYAVIDKPLRYAARFGGGRGHRAAMLVVGPVERAVNEIVAPVIERRGRRT